MAKRRKRGNGSVRLRKDGRWEGRYVVGRNEKGFPISKNVLAKSKAECVAKLEQLRKSLQEPVTDPPKSGVLLGDWLNIWYQEYKKANLRPNTQMSYERRIYQHIIPALGGIQLDKLTTGEIQKFYTQLKQSGRLVRAELYGEGLSDQTVRGIHTTFHAALNQAVKENLIFHNPSDGCRPPSAKSREMNVLTPEEIQRLLIQAREDGCYELLLLELSTGLRRGEICALKWDDLNLKTRTLRVERQVHRVKGELVVSQPKTKASNRSVVLPAPVLTVLKNYKKTVHSQWMFPSPVKEDSPQDPAAAKIDQGIGKQPPKAETENVPRKPAPSTFQAYKGQRRKPGTGCLSQINDYLWEGRYSPIWPDGKKHARNVYAKTREECEELLAHLIQQMKAEIAAEKERLRQQEYAS